MLTIRTITVAVISTLCLVSFVGTQEKREEQKIELVPVYEKTFEDTIVDVIFDEAEVSVEEAKTFGWKGLEEKEPKEKITILYPKVIMMKKTIKFIDIGGREKTKWTGGGLRSIIKISKSDRFISIYSVLKEDEKKHIPKKVAFSVLDTDGKLIWRRDDIPPALDGLMISANGDYAVAPSLWENGRLRFFDSRGLIKTVDPLKEGSECYSFSFSIKRNLCAVNFGDKGAWLILYDSAGNEIWRRSLDLDFSNEVEISNNGKYIAAIASAKNSEVRNLYLYNNKGTLLWKYRVEYIGNYIIKFSPEASYVTILSSSNHFLFFEARSGKLLWKYRGSNVNRAFLACDVSSEGKYIIVGGGSYIPPEFPAAGSRYVYLFNKDGLKLFEKEFDEGHYTSWDQGPKIKIELNGEEIIITTSEGVYIYTNPDIPPNDD